MKKIGIVDLGTVGGTDFAHELIKKALENGKDIVTANKTLMTVKGVRILNCQRVLKSNPRCFF